MKALYFLFLLAFLVLQVQSDPHPPIQHEAEIKEALEQAAYQADRKELKKETAESRAATVPCNGGKGSCLFRKYYCSSSYVFSEKYNDCPNTKDLKCCVAE